ncbi:MAG: tRNA (N6-isopentenyl adenosine(37)-C2)-methylthiotransferase MiaB [Cytophagales bacterium]|nr:tRNA (N6-isopentenyl adenosine(37)-C2)-methylthiotransferase MiaB [Cytophagales bacterium]
MKPKLYIETYGCQMNFADTEIVASIMQKDGYNTTSEIANADIIFVNTCSIRDKAEQRVRKRLLYFNSLKKKNPNLKIGILGCMAERLKSKLLEEEKIVDMVVGPDAYRDIPNLLKEVDDHHKAVNVYLSREETYADISPVRLNSNGVTAFISIMRGCDNMCSFCVVPFTRGRERSRDPYSIVKEARDLFDKGYREVTLLGQNVDSYKWEMEGSSGSNNDYNNNNNNGKSNGKVPPLGRPMSSGHRASIAEGRRAGTINFAQLLEKVALISPELRVRFTTSHPKDMTDEVLYTMKKYDNICKNIHLPAQSGNSRVLKLMNRTYDREWYMERIKAIRSILGDDCGITTDFITGFCTETEKEHKDTLSLMEWVEYDYAYMFTYSERPGTLAAKKYKNNIPEDIKKRRLSEIIQLQQKYALERNHLALNKIHKVLIEGFSKRSKDDLSGRNSENKVVVFPVLNGHSNAGSIQKGDYVDVLVRKCTAATLLGEIISA